MDTDEPLTWAQVIPDFRDSLIVAGRRPATIDIRVAGITRFSEAVSVDPPSVRPIDVVRYLARPSWAINTRKTESGTLKAFFAWALDAGVVTEDPTKSLPRIPVPKRVIEPVERRAINAAIASSPRRIALLIKLAADAGLSAMEIAACHPKDLRRTPDGDDELGVYGKGGVRNWVELPPALAEEIRAYGNGYVFAGRMDGHIAPAYVSKLISRAFPPGVTAEDVRQAYTVSRTGRRAASWRDARPYHSPTETRLLDHSDLADVKVLRQQLHRIERDLNADPASALSECKNLLESLFKVVLADRGVDVGAHWRFAQLYELVAATLDLPVVVGSERGTQSVRDIIDGLAAVVVGITQTRNALGTGHGTGQTSPAEPRHARLVFNATVALAEFVADSWIARVRD